MPSWRTHRAIVKAAWPPELPRGDLLRGVLEGVVEPDVAVDMITRCWRGRCRQVRAPHHEPQDGIAEWYYDLAHFFRARGDLFNAGKALGRALHYLHDGAVKRRKWLILDVHDDVEDKMEELVERLPHICNGVRARRSNEPAEALCYAYERTVALLRKFATEAVPPEEGVRYKKKGRLKKLSAFVAAALASLAAALAFPPAVILVAPASALAAALWTPREYVLAMRGGAMCLEPMWFKPAMTC